MNVRFTVAVSDGEGNTYHSGRAYDLDKAEADHWVGLGYAEIVDGPKPKTSPAKKAAAPKPTTGTTKEEPVTDAPKPEPKKAPAKRTAKKTATKRTATKRATSTAEKG